MIRLHRTPVPWVLGSVAVFGACDAGTDPRPTGLEYVVERFEVVEEQPTWSPFPVASLQTRISVVNWAPVSVSIHWGGCPFELTASPEAASDEEDPVWRSWARNSWPTSVPIGCSLELNGVRVAPGDTLRPALGVPILLAHVLADSLAPGRYAFRALLDLGHGGRALDLGSVELPESRFPIWPSPVGRDGFSYEVSLGAPDPSSGDVAVGLTVSNVQSFPLARTLSSSCPVRLMAFADAVEQTTIPEPEPAWRWPSSCGAETEEVALAGSASRAFTDTLSTAALLDAGVSPGAYRLTAVVEVDARPIRIDAGEVELAP